MTILLDNLDTRALTSNKIFDYLIVGDGSVSHLEERMTWSSLVITQNGNTELIYGMVKSHSDVHIAELMPCLMAMRNIRNRLTKDLTYKLRIHVITDNSNLVAQFKNKSSCFYNCGIWQEIRSYDTHFDTLWEYQPRRSNKVLMLVDDMCSELNSTLKTVNDKAMKFCQQRSQGFVKQDKHLSLAK